MTSGIVNADFEAIISLSICDSEGKIYAQDAIVDTGFNGWGLHCRQTYRLNLKLKRRGRAILGDDSECVFNVYEADVIWDGHYMTIPIDEADSEQF